MKSALIQVVNACQLIGAASSTPERIKGLDTLVGILNGLDTTMSSRNRLGITHVLATLFSHLARQDKTEDEALMRATCGICAARIDSPMWSSALAAIIADFARNRSDDSVPRPTPSEPRVARAVEYARMYPGPRLRLADVATQVGLSPWHLERLVRRTYGMGLVSLVRRARVEGVSIHLRESTMSLKEIACIVGFSSVQQLTRGFKAVYGLPPSEYRARLSRAAIGSRESLSEARNECK